MLIQTPTLIALAAGLIAVLITAIVVAQRLYNEGYAKAERRFNHALNSKNLYIEELTDLTDKAHDKLIAEKSAHEQSRHNAAQALEQMELTHQEEREAELSKLRKANRTLEMLELSHQQEREAFKAELRAARTLLSDQELELIIAMAEKLKLASASLHATQHYKDAKQAKALGDSGLRLAHSIADRQPGVERAA